MTSIFGGKVEELVIGSAVSKDAREFKKIYIAHRIHQRIPKFTNPDFHDVFSTNLNKFKKSHLLLLFRLKNQICRLVKNSM